MHLSWTDRKLHNKDFACNMRAESSLDSRLPTTKSQFAIIIYMYTVLYSSHNLTVEYVHYMDGGYLGRSVGGNTVKPFTSRNVMRPNLDRRLFIPVILMKSIYTPKLCSIISKDQTGL